jgi:hypothetical protein
LQIHLPQNISCLHQSIRSIERTLPTPSVPIIPIPIISHPIIKVPLSRIVTPLIIRKHRIRQLASQPIIIVAPSGINIRDVVFGLEPGLLLLIACFLRRTFPSLRGRDGGVFIFIFGVFVLGDEFREGAFVFLCCCGGGGVGDAFAFSPGGIEGRPEFAGVEGQV